MAARRGARTTLMDLARATGLSHMTVQRALLGNASVRAETRTKVLEAADRLGYRANASARAMRRGRFGHIGLLLPAMGGSTDSSTALMAGIDAVLAERDLHLMPTLLPEGRAASGARMPRLIEQAMIDGLLIAPDLHLPSTVIEHLDRFTIPHIWVNARRSQDCVVSDGQGAGRDATRRLIALGHRHIHFVAGCDDDASESTGHYPGYVSAMQAAGLTVAASRGEAEMVTMFAHAPEVTAVVVSGDESALWSLHHRIRASGREIAVVSLRAYLPAYLGLDVPHYRLDQAALGSAAARALLRKLDAPDQPLAPILVPFTRVDAGVALAPPPH